MITEPSLVWVFNGSKNRFPSAVFADRPSAENWIRTHRLSGTLTAYPVGISVYDWAVGNGHFRPKQDWQTSAAFIENFSSASQEHYHFENGIGGHDDDGTVANTGDSTA